MPADSNTNSDSLSKFFQDNPTLLPSLIAGGGGGILGGLISASRPQQAGEDRGMRRRRILKNALISALSTGGATSLGLNAFNTLSSAVPTQEKGLSDKLLSVVDFGLLPALKGGLAYAAGGLGHMVDATRAGTVEKVKNILGNKFLTKGPLARYNAALNIPGTSLTTKTININNPVLEKIVGQNYKGLARRLGGLLLAPSIISDFRKGLGYTE